MIKPSSIAESGDVALVSAVLNGDREAYASLVRRHQAAVCGMAYSVCGDFATREDIAEGGLLALGGVAVAPIAVGGATLGLKAETAKRAAF